jgi:PAS domain S-box-containing protein
MDITERNKSEQILQAAQNRLQFLLSVTPAVIYTCKADGDYSLTFISDNVAIQLGYEAHECLEDTYFWANHVHPDDAGAFFAKLAGLADCNASNDSYEYRFQHKDGTYRWMQDDPKLIRHEKGLSHEITGYLIDITARKTAEKALDRQTRQLMDAQRLAHIGSWDWDLETETVIWSDEHYRIFGVDPKTYRPTYETNMQFVHPDDRQRGVEAVEAAIRERGAFHMELRLVRADGVECHVISRGEITTDGAGRPVRMVGTIQDITERKLAEEALRESEAKFRALAEASPALIALLDPDANLVYMNQRHREMYGETWFEIMGAGWHSIVHPDDALSYIPAIEQALRDRARFQQRVRVKSKDDEWRWVEAYGLPWFAAEGQYAGHVFVTLDITRTVQAEEALMEADRRKDEFLATLAHELRNPLAPICNLMPLIGRPGGVRAADRLQEVMERQVKQLVRLVDDLMEVSRVTRGKIELLKAPLQLADVVRSAIEESQPLIDRARHQLSVTFPEDSLTLDADAVRLTQVFANLLNNAVKYTEKGGRIWLTAYRDGNDAVVSVRDNGIGMRQEMLARVFEMFAQETHSSGRSQGGLGIGLTLVYNLVKMHGGSVEAKSEGQGRGSEFRVRLPLSQKSWPANSSEAGGAPRTLATRRLLVVDDNPDAADSLAMLLESLGAEMHVVNDGLCALAALETFRPDVVLLDIGMPGMDGYEVARRIRQQPKFNNITLIAVTGWGQEGDRLISRASGFNHHLTKPIDVTALQDLLVARP